MKKTGYLLVCFFLFCIHSYAQQNKSIVNELNTYRPQQGRIIIYQDDAVAKMLGQNVILSSSSISQNQLSSNKSDENNTRDHVVKTRGYRIQIYSGNDQRRSKNIAESRRNQIKSAYPNMDVSISYSSPVWRVRAGSFRTRAEADQALKNMRSRFSSFGREMHIVDDVITVSVN